MRVGLDGELLKQLIKARSGVGAFLGQWNSLSLKADDHPDNSTVYRWIKGESVPKNGDLFLRLAGFLDVDPFALVAVPDGDILAAADELLRIVQHSSTAPSWLQFVHGFFGRQINWPPEDLASMYFNRPWHVAEFRHDATARTNFYPTVVLCQAVKAPEGRPQVFHFAYRHPTLFHARWLQYGLVRVHGRSVALHHISGYIDRLHRSGPDEPIRVETWFGPGSALFRVASLHPFSHSIDDSGDGSAKALRFPA
jgi:hypothetical protein